MIKKSSQFQLHLMAAAFLIAGMIAGCAPIYQIKVDAIAAPSAPEGKDYVLLPGMPGMSNNDLHFKEYSVYVANVLEDNGYRQVAKKEECQLLIYLSYGIGTPNPTNYTNIAAADSSSPGRTILSPHPDPAPAVVYLSRYNDMRRYPFASPGHYRDFRLRPGYYPGYFPGYDPDYYSPYEIYPLYQRYMILEAVDYPASKSRGEPVPVWKVTVSDWGERNDIREVFPALAAAAGEYIGADTGAEVEVNLSGNDARVQRLKNLR
jgi:hypothetical protein